MRVLKRHWRVSTVVALAIVLATAWIWQNASARMAMLVMDPDPPPNYEPLDRTTADRIRGVLEQIKLDRDALIALNPSAAQAEDILAEVRSWQASNAATLASLKNTIDEKVHAVRVLEKAIRMGTAGENAQERLALAVTDRTNANAAYDNAFSSLRTSINNLLSGSQQATWTAIQTGHGQHMPIRMLALSDAQRIAVSKAKRTYERRRAAASNSEARTAALNTWNNDLDSILTNDQKTVVTSFYSNYGSASANVGTAIDTVLPVEEQQGV